MVLPLPFAAIFALFVSAGVPEGPGLAWGGLAGSCLAGVIFGARSARELIAGLAGFGSGTAIGALLDLDSCSRVGIVIGPVVGLLLASTIARSGKGRREVSARPADNSERTVG